MSNTIIESDSEFVELFVSLVWFIRGATTEEILEDQIISCSPLLLFEYQGAHDQSYGQRQKQPVLAWSIPPANFLEVDTDAVIEEINMVDSAGQVMSHCFTTMSISCNAIATQATAGCYGLEHSY